MVLFNYSTRELTAKIVYYGPGLCGKTTNLQYIHANLPETIKGKMLSLATKTDRTLFFDFLPIDLGEIRGMKTRVQLYTVPGQVFYNETRKLVLKGADAIVFVADSQQQMMGANVESFRNLEENLRGHGMRLQEMPHVLQFNKRDLPRLASIEELNASINKYNAPFYESVATTGIGVQDTLKAVVKLVLLNLTRRYEAKGASAAERPAPVPPRAAATTVRGPAVPPSAPPEPPRAASLEASRRAPSMQARSIPVSSSDLPAERPVSIPLSPIEMPPQREAAAVPPPPDFRGVSLAASGRDDDLTFEEEEVEGLVEEVEEIGADEVHEIAAESPPSSAPNMGATLAEERDPDLLGGDPPIVPIPVSIEEPETPSPDVRPVPAEIRTEEAETSWAGETRPAEDPFPTAAVEEPLTPIADLLESGSAARPPEADPDWLEAQPPGEPQFVVDVDFDPEARAAAAEPARDLRADAPAGAPPAATVAEPPESAGWVGEEPWDAGSAGLAETPEAGEPVPVVFEPAARATGEGEGAVLLTDATEDAELFEDPDLDVARLTAGDCREIVVPVEIGRGSEARRFRLSLRLKLEPIE